MKINTQDYNNITVVELQGELSVESTQALQDIVSNHIAEGASGIVIDMTNVSFIDSKGLEELLWLRDYCRENNRQLKIAGMDETCTKIMEITRLQPKYDIYIELSEAVKSFA